MHCSKRFRKLLRYKDDIIITVVALFFASIVACMQLLPLQGQATPTYGPLHIPGATTKRVIVRPHSPAPSIHQGPTSCSPSQRRNGKCRAH